MSVTFTEKELGQIAAHLLIAAERYESMAADMRLAAVSASRSASVRLRIVAAGFDRQAKEVRGYMQRIDPAYKG